MRNAHELAGLVEALRAPIGDFVRSTRVRVALLVTGSGQVLAQHGFGRGFELAGVASLAAATHASSQKLAELTGLERWMHLHHAGSEREIFLAPVRTPAEELILVAIFDEDASLGIVQLYFDALIERLAGLAAFQRPQAPADVARFERDLEAGLDRIFSQDPSGSH